MLTSNIINCNGIVLTETFSGNGDGFFTLHRPNGEYSSHYTYVNPSERGDEAVIALRETALEIDFINRNR